MSVQDVLSGQSRWYIDASDNLPWLQNLPTGCASLILTSPPYSSQRTYGVNFALQGEAWVEWMIPRVVEMCRVTDGLVSINAAGPVKDGSYSPIMEWLVSDLTRKHGILCGPQPYVYFRFGIPGSGNKNYHRRDWEPVYCFARKECLPLKWSDNTAEGHAPKWAPGGEMSNRTQSGKRATAGPSASTAVIVGDLGPPLPGMEVEDVAVNPWGESWGEHSIRRHPDGMKMKPTGKAIKRSGQPKQQDDDKPVIANPGNVVKQTYDALEVHKLLEDLVTQKIEPGDFIRCLAGGGNMGSKLAHANEAPFSERLCEFFINSYCPPGGIVLDPFSGSGTTCAVAVRLGRRALGCDLRPEQVEIARRRIGGETPDLFGE